MYFPESVRMTAVKNVLSGISSGQLHKLKEQENEPLTRLQVLVLLPFCFLPY